jgi:parallel beta-helix repeat protein
MKTFLTHSLLAAYLTLLTVAGYGQPIPITSVPFSINQPGKYVLQSDLTLTVDARIPATQIAIGVLASDVELDLNGFSLFGPQGSSVASVGVAVSTQNNVVIRNGEISDFTLGIHTASASRTIIDSVRLSNNDFRGILASGCHNIVIRNCEISKTTPNNLSRFPNTAGITLAAGFGNQVINTNVAGTAKVLYSFGILSIESAGNYFENLYIVSCGFGMSLSSPDKYRAITTTDCPTGISGGIDVDGQSN